MTAMLRAVQEELREAGGANAHLARKRARYGPDAVSGLLPHQRMKDVQALCAPHTPKDDHDSLLFMVASVGGMGYARESVPLRCWVMSSVVQGRGARCVGIVRHSRGSGAYASGGVGRIMWHA